jgi:hypothetical protein
MMIVHDFADSDNSYLFSRQFVFFLAEECH